MARAGSQSRLSDSLSLINNGVILGAANGSIDNLLDPGAYLVSNAVGLPQGSYAYGVLLVFRIPDGTAAIQIYVTDSAVPRVYIRQRWGTASWQSWGVVQITS